MLGAGAPAAVICASCVVAGQRPCRRQLSSSWPVRVSQTATASVHVAAQRAAFIGSVQAQVDWWAGL